MPPRARYIYIYFRAIGDSRVLLQTRHFGVTQVRLSVWMFLHIQLSCIVLSGKRVPQTLRHSSCASWPKEIRQPFFLLPRLFRFSLGYTLWAKRIVTDERSLNY